MAGKPAAANSLGPRPVVVRMAVRQRDVSAASGSLRSAVRVFLRSGGLRVSSNSSSEGATIGAVAGYAIADRRDRWRGGLLGGVLGAAAGKAAERGARKKKGFQLIIRLESTGEEIGVQVVGKKQA